MSCRVLERIHTSLIQLQLDEDVFVYIEMWSWMYILGDDFVYKAFDFLVVAAKSFAFRRTLRLRTLSLKI